MAYYYSPGDGRKYAQQQWAIRQGRQRRKARLTELKAKEKEMDRVIKRAAGEALQRITLFVHQPKKQGKAWNRKMSPATLGKWGLTIADATAILEVQKWSCLICCGQFTRTPHIDHCHASGKRRGFLCYQCNPGLGMFKDNAENLRRAANYIDIYNGVLSPDVHNNPFGGGSGEMPLADPPKEDYPPPPASHPGTQRSQMPCEGGRDESPALKVTPHHAQTTGPG